MELRDYLTILGRRWLMVVSCALLGLLAAGLVTLSATPTYDSTSQVYVSVQTQDGSTQGLVQGSTYTQSQVAGFADLATSPLVLDPVINELGLPLSASELADDVTASVRLDTSLIDVTVTSPVPDDAAELSNAVAASMIAVLPELQRPLDSAVSPVRITVTRAAESATAQASPNVQINLALGLVAGLAFGMALAILRATTDTRIRGESDLRGVADHPVLGVVGFDPTADDDPLVIASNPLSPRAESVRRLRTNLQFINAPSRPKSIVITSSLPGEGKSTTSANLALALADAGNRVLLIDADLRRPTLHRLLGLESAVGLTTVLIGQVEVADALQRWGDSELDVLTAGVIPPNPSELLGSRQMVELLEDVTSQYDVVLLDTAPLLAVTDGAVVAKLADGALIVVSADLAHKSQVEAAQKALGTVEATVLGLVLNRVHQEKGDEYRYAYVNEPIDPTPAKSRRLGVRSRAERHKNATGVARS